MIKEENIRMAIFALRNLLETHNLSILVEDFQLWAYMQENLEEFECPLVSIASCNDWINGLSVEDNSAEYEDKEECSNCALYATPKCTHQFIRFQQELKKILNSLFS